jgi:hypothetical protein
LIAGEEGLTGSPFCTAAMSGATLWRKRPISFIVEALGRSWRASLMAAP